MIGRLRGIIASDSSDGTALIDVHGVGYDVHVPLGALGRVPVEPDGSQTLFIHTVFRQDALELFGFPNEVERACFRALVAVPNVGPKTALGVLSFLSPAELSTAIEAGDLAKLAKAPGIGKRTAERIVVELKGKLAPLAAVSVGVAPKSATNHANADRLTAALTNMGYRPAEAARAVEKLGDSVETKSLAELLREALALLTR
ncbi:MAG: Holliday junction branch migration protein RuvA [Polyangiaceae bacterium]